MDPAKAADRFRELYGGEVEVLSAEGEEVWARFSGAICHTCGAADYFDDFAQLLGEEAGEEWGLAGYLQLDDGSYLAAFRPKRLIGEVRRHVRVVIYR